MPKRPQLFTLQSIRRECEQGSREAWQAFLGCYSPLVFKLLEIYRPSTPERHKEFWQETLNELCAKNFERLRTMSSQAEREFLVDLRAFIFERGARNLAAADDTAAAAGPTPESVSALLEGLPLLHQEIAFFKLAGYSDKTIEKFLRVTPAVAQKGLERLSADYSLALQREQDKCLWPQAWSAVLEHAREAKKEQCPPLRQFIRILDGQTSWSDKEPAEQHISSCLHCLERWTALGEVGYWRLEAKPLAAAELDELLSSLPIGAGSSSRRPFFRRVFGG